MIRFIWGLRLLDDPQLVIRLTDINPLPIPRDNMDQSPGLAARNWRIIPKHGSPRGLGAPQPSRDAPPSRGPAQDLLLRNVKAALPTGPRVLESNARRWLGDVLAGIGAAAAGFMAAGVQGLGFTGQVMARLGATLVRPRRLRLTALVHHMQEVALNAVPIVALMGFLIGVVLAFQGATQLRQFGAEVFVVDLITEVTPVTTRNRPSQRS